MFIGQALLDFVPKKWLHDKLFRDESEHLENPYIGFHERFAVVAELSRVNQRSGLIRSMLKEFEAQLGNLDDWRSINRPLRIVDIGPGGGALLAALHQWSKDNNLPVELFGIDIDSELAQFMENKLNSQSIPVRIIHGDGADLRRFPENSFDFVLSSQVIHHIRKTDEVTQCFNEIFHIAKYGWVVVDLDKRLTGPLFMRITSTFYNCSKRLTEDGIKSARRAYSCKEINDLISNDQMSCSPHPLYPYWLVKGRKN